MHFFLRKLVEKNYDKIRLIHRHFPMDHKYNPIVKDPFHIGSGKMALLAEYANFLNIKKLAEKTGLDFRALSYSTKDRMIRYKVKHDIAIGMKLGINGTPGYVIGGKVYLGQIPPEVLSRVLD